MRFDPAQALGMGQDRNITSDHQIEKHVLEPGWRNMMGRFNQHVARVAKRKQVARAKFGHKRWGDVVVGASYQLQRDIRLP